MTIPTSVPLSAHALPPDVALSPRAAKALAAARELADADGAFSLPVRTIAAAAGLPVTTWRRALLDLQAAGLLEVTAQDDPSGKGAGWPNLYTLTNGAGER